MGTGRHRAEPPDVRGLGGAWTRHQRHTSVAPPPDLAVWVDHVWVVAWDYDAPYRQPVVPYPQVHLTFSGGGATVSGVASRYQVKVLEGDGGVLGVAFRPGGFRPFLGTAVSSLRDRSVDAREVLGAAVPRLPARPTTQDAGPVVAFLRAVAPGPDPLAAQATDVVARIAATPALTRVDAVARDAGTSVRGLQRLFGGYVGIGPKWVIRRYRLHEVTRRLAAGEDVGWAGLAHDLGFADQAHLVRDFTKMFGEPPTRYAARYGPPGGVPAGPTVGGGA
ncbi:MAG: DUF6597 domain-containing transcriptional factor [Kineosporiaceae bacterium]